MDIMRLFGRVFAAQAAEEEEETKKEPLSSSPPTETVILRRKKVNDEEDNTKKPLPQHHNRLSLCNYSIDIDEELTVPDSIAGTDWESAAYEVDRFSCRQEEVTALAATEKYVVLQYHTDPDIDVYDRGNTKDVLFRLEGHVYGGQCLQASGDILYSGSMDKTVRTWNLANGGSPIETIYNHLDYVESLALLPNRWAASGGRGDKAIFVYETDANGKLWRRHRFEGHEGWVTQLLFVDAGGDTMASGGADATVRIWDLRRGCALRVFRQDDAVTCLALSSVSPDVLLVSDSTGKMSFLDLETRETTHLLPNVMVAAGRYARSSRYHDKAVDVVHATDNGYLVTASAGSRHVKVWRIVHGADPTDHSGTEVTELQILQRESAAFMTAMVVFQRTVLSASSDGSVHLHTFPSGKPHYEMATGEAAESGAICNRGGLASPQSATEVCRGPGLCRTGKTGLVRSSSSFQVSFQLTRKKTQEDTSSSAAASEVCALVRLPSRRRLCPQVLEEEEEEEEEDSSDDDDSSVGEIELSTSSSEEEESDSD